MMKFLSRSAVLLALISANSLAEQTVEWAPFVKTEQATIAQLLQQAERVNREFLSQQPGFIERRLVQKDSQTFADVVHWQSIEAAQNAAAKVADCEPCQQYFSLMNLSSSEQAGAGFSYFQVLRRW